MPATIKSILGTTVLDSRGNPTLSVEVECSDGSKGVFSVPSGASTGAHEAHELRDNETHHGSVVRALTHLEKDIAPRLVGCGVTDQEGIDKLLIEIDGTPNKERFGGNTLIGVSIACAKAAAASEKQEVWSYLNGKYFSDTQPAFPRLYANLVNGGKHVIGTDLAFQEYLVVPKTDNITEASHIIQEMQDRLDVVVTEQFGKVKKGDEGGCALPMRDVETPLQLLNDVAHYLNLRERVDFALDVAASSFYKEGTYLIGKVEYEEASLVTLIENLVHHYGLLSVEDPFNEESFESFAELKERLPQTLFVGDDLTTTNKERLAMAIASKSIGAIIIKPNQIGTLTETIETMKLARENGIKCIVSHRSGETMDTFIADLAYASAAFGIKLGAHGPKEREAKYKRLKEIYQYRMLH